MAGSFSSINTALTGLNYNRVALDVAGNNIANVGTEGYARRSINAETIASPPRPGLWSGFDGGQFGVKVGSIDRMVDPLLDARARHEHGSQASVDIRQTVMARIEAAIGEPSDTGLAALLDDFKASWEDLANSPNSDAVRSAVIGKAEALVAALHTQGRSIDTEAADLDFKVQVDVREVNRLAADLASTNKAIASASLTQSDTGTLEDQRDMIAMRLAELTGGVATARSDGGFDVHINGVALVTGGDAGELASTTDANGLGFHVSGLDASPQPITTVGGELGGLTHLLNDTLPGLRAGLENITIALADQVNGQHTQGYDKGGVNPGQDFFTYDPADPVATLTVAISEPAHVAAAAVPGGSLDVENAHAIADAITVGAQWQQFVADLGLEVNSLNRLAATQQSLTDQVDSAREQLGGVNLDEEMINMLQAQRAYEASARLMNVVDSMLDTLINRTGLVR